MSNVFFIQLKINLKKKRNSKSKNFNSFFIKIERRVHHRQKSNISKKKTALFPLWPVCVRLKRRQRPKIWGFIERERSEGRALTRETVAGASIDCQRERARGLRGSLSSRRRASKYTHPQALATHSLSVMLLPLAHVGIYCHKRQKNLKRNKKLFFKFLWKKLFFFLKRERERKREIMRRREPSWISVWLCNFFTSPEGIKVAKVQHSLKLWQRLGLRVLKSKIYFLAPPPRSRDLQVLRG